LIGGTEWLRVSCLPESMSAPAISRVSAQGSYLTNEQVLEIIREACPTSEYGGKKVLLIVPDATRTCPLGMLFKGIFDQIGGGTAAFDVMIALGTHQPMDEEAIRHRLEISVEERRTKYGTIRLFNHEWDNPSALKHIGTIPASEIKNLSGGLFAMDVPVTINRRLFEYDQIIIAGPVFPHEVVGFSGGNKYLFPGVSGPEVLNFFHWLGAVVTNPMIRQQIHTSA
jgi:nickel-dependent lactate racemase